jgi:hypothetical protein
MVLIALKCPSCGGAVEMDEAMEKGFCIYCGQAIINETTTVVNVTNIIARSDKFYVLAYQKGIQTKHLIKNKLTLIGEYRKDALYGDRNPLLLTMKNDDSLVDRRIIGGAFPMKEINIVQETDRLVLLNDHGVPLIINGQTDTSSERTIRYSDMIRMGNVIIRVLPHERPQ